MLAVLVLSPAVYAQTAEEWYHDGKIKLISRDYEEAIKCFDKAI